MSGEKTTAEANPVDPQGRIKESMDRMYRWTRHVYDTSRKYYLLGRDELIKALEPAEHEHVCEVGCGTARNLVKMARRYPLAYFYGLDVSDEMLKTARKTLKSARLTDTVRLKQGYAQNFDPAALFGSHAAPLGKIVFSYALSIIPPWRESIDHALMLLPPGGQIHIVDFGGQEGLPRWFRALLFWWLSLFHVHYKPEIFEYLKRLEFEKAGTLDLKPIYRGYALYAVFTKA